MDNFTCSYCSSSIPLTKDTYFEFGLSFNHFGFKTAATDLSDAINVNFVKCPKCKEVTIWINGTGEKTKGITTYFKPNSLAKQFPEYIPVAIRNDYEEACAIVNLSPKASATLSRRCLQNMIRDFWKISGKKRLVDEIDALQEKVPASQWKILNSLRRIGNIGAHPEADVNLIIDIEPSDAQKLISVIELLIKQWYIERHEQEELYNDVLTIDENTKNQKNKE